MNSIAICRRIVLLVLLLAVMPFSWPGRRAPNQLLHRTRKRANQNSGPIMSGMLMENARR